MTEEYILSNIVVNPSTACWIWTATIEKDGYGQIWNGKRTLKAHRVSYEIFIGPLDSKLVIDHTCRTRNCVSPHHLRQVSKKLNSLENSVSTAALNKKKTHCSRGHIFDSKNTRFDKNGGRACRICHKIWQRKRRDSVVERSL